MAPADGDARPADQAQLPLFRVLLAVQAVAATVFGLAPFLAPEAFASIGGFSGSEPFVYRLAGAATFGYAVAAVLGLMRPRWIGLRIPMIATFAFNAAAVLATALSLTDGEGSWLVLFILGAASVFALLSGYWLIRDEGPPPPPDTITGTFRAVLGAATLAAAVFGTLPLLAPVAMATIAGFDSRDLFPFRLAAAGTLGYAAAGVAQVRSGNPAAIRIQVIAAAVFNGLSAVAVGIYLLAGGRSLIAIVILVAAAAFTVAFAWWLSTDGGGDSTA